MSTTEIVSVSSSVVLFIIVVLQRIKISKLNGYFKTRLTNLEKMMLDTNGRIKKYE